MLGRGGGGGVDADPGRLRRLDLDHLYGVQRGRHAEPHWRPQVRSQHYLLPDFLLLWRTWCGIRGSGASDVFLRGDGDKMELR